MSSGPKKSHGLVKRMLKILVIDTGPGFREFLARELAIPADAIDLNSGKGLGPHLRKEHYDIIFLYCRAGATDPVRTLREIKSVSHATPVVALGEVAEAGVIVETIKEGAFDFLTEPFTKEKIESCMDRAIENRGLKNEIDYLRHEQDFIYDFDRIIAQSPSMHRVMAGLKKFARTDSSILITGETGTGKSFLSGAIHFNSNRRERPFIKINCSNIPETLLESELFGHERGAFTGANKTRVGRMEQGRDGSVFLDEIGEMTPSLQARLLRVVEDKSFERVGGNKTIHSDVRIISATNRDLEAQVADGAFREDLYYRINVLRLHLPPLRERTECIEPLARFLLKKACQGLKKYVSGFGPGVIEEFETNPWPGNIRQLANVIERAAILEESDLIRPENVTPTGRTAPRPAPAPDAPRYSIKDQEKEAILRALEDSLWVQKDAAELLGISPRAINYKIRRLGITSPRWRKNR